MSFNTRPVISESAALVSGGGGFLTERLFLRVFAPDLETSLGIRVVVALGVAGSTAAALGPDVEDAAAGRDAGLGVAVAFGASRRAYASRSGPSVAPSAIATSGQSRAQARRLRRRVMRSIVPRGSTNVESM
jgi:hypothetical protein